MTVPDHLSYTDQHEWLDLQDGVARVGITAYAAGALGDVVYVQLPEVGERLTAGSTCGELESTKSVSDLCSPADGEVLEVNREVLDNSGLVNDDPFGAGWLFTVRVSGEPELLDATAYRQLTEEG
ncbi:glycine cleavage system protein GcvH [Quadrisphaera oryzae]|uniref:glycine cleavage system protein GcvH n=1 Tax=Quadrisphaera TaxID=317661 RepID=UPI0016481EF3|nr:glycine cleavage system protein GcvH [Quadrisphaera sp. RL12-1S]MBC3760641.1 glycine cleavage system protein GcvH [Quadrisphaera sp. RL12-1S]